MNINTELDYYVWVEIDVYDEIPIDYLRSDKDDIARTYLPVIGISDDGFALFLNPITGKVQATNEDDELLSVAGVVSSLASILTIQRLLSPDNFEDNANASLNDYFG